MEAWGHMRAFGAHGSLGGTWKPGGIWELLGHMEAWEVYGSLGAYGSLEGTWKLVRYMAGTGSANV